MDAASDAAPQMDAASHDLAQCQRELELVAEEAMAKMTGMMNTDGVARRLSDFILSEGGEP